MPPPTTRYPPAVCGAWLFINTGVVAIIVAGTLSAALAHAPTRAAMWLTAYLVLVVGVAQIGLGVGQARLALWPPTAALLGSEWLLFNVANALVISGRLLVWPAAVTVGAVVLAVALGLFLRGVRGAGGGWLLQVYRLLVALLACSALVGVGLSLFTTQATWRPDA
jgi:hypothetical protein